MNRSSILLYYLFSLLFLLFCWNFTNYWNDYMTDASNVSGASMNKAAAILVIYGLFLWFASRISCKKGIHLVCILWTLLMPIIMLINREYVFTFSSTIIWPVLFEVMYLFCLQGEAVRKTRYIFVFLAIYGTILFLLSRQDFSIQTNTVYFVLLTLPWLLYGQKRKNVVVILLLLTVAALISFKRSAMLSMVLVWFFFFMEEIGHRRNKLYVITFFVVLFIGIDQLYDRIDEIGRGVLTTRVVQEETGEGRNRIAIWDITISMIQSSSKVDLLTGHGHGAVKRDSFLEISAHNDFLEVIYDYGLVIFFLYLCLWWYVVKKCYRLYRNHSSLFVPYAASLSIFIVMSMVSHLILYTSYFNYLVMFWGMSEALTSQIIIRKQNQIQ